MNAYGEPSHSYSPPPPPTVLPIRWMLERYLFHLHSSLPLLDHEGRFWGVLPVQVVNQHLMRLTLGKPHRL